MSNSKTVHKAAPAKATKKAAASAPKSHRPGQASAKAASVVPDLAPASLAAPVKPKHKLVRDSFTIPKSEYTVLEGMKDRGTQLARPVKKGELLRAGINALHKMTDKAFLAALNDVPSLKTGRPKAPEATASVTKAGK